jgi:cobalt/nickel transport system permease protein
MHMADALLSPAVGGTMWGASAVAIAYCSKKVRSGMDDRRIPLMGVLGAFIFAAQMINFTIPVTGSSGHLGGGLILSILLGPYAAFLTIASVLVVQAFFFADGGLLALGCNMFNLGFFPAFIAYPIVYKKIVAGTPTPARITVASIVAAIIGVQLGALGVVVETVMSGISSLPFSTFAVIMQPIHLAIGIVEGMVTASVISFVHNAKPDIIQSAMEVRPMGNQSMRTVVRAFLVAAAVTGGGVSWFASNNPDGLEWAITRVTGQEKLNGAEQGVHSALAALQEKTAFLPDYSFRRPAGTSASSPENKKRRIEVQSGDIRSLATSISGLLGGVLTLGISFLIALLLKRRQRACPR